MSTTTWSSEFPQAAHALAKAKLHGRTGQAYLLIGDSTEQLERFALGWAQTAACTSPQPDGMPCGHCRNCTLLQDGNYSELVRLAPESKSRIIPVDAMHEFERKIILAVPEGMLKIGLIVEADCMKTEAANAFLKTLEEPPRDVMLLLLTTRPQLLLPTIHSRCQKVLLLNNKFNYNNLVPKEYLETLATLHRNAGTRVALRAISALQELFGGLQAKAEETVKANWDPQWDDLAAEDKSLRKQVEEQKKNKIATEYLRLREAYLNTLQAWFQQRYLVAVGVPETSLPQPEFLPYAQGAAPTREEAEEDNETVRTFIRALKANVPEELDLAAFALQICRKG
jgi:hypothetical protein